MCGFCNVWVCVCVGFCNVWVCVCVGFVMYVSFGNMLTCICCVLYCLYCVFCIVSFMYTFPYLFFSVLPPSDNSITVSSNNNNNNNNLLLHVSGQLPPSGNLHHCCLNVRL
jgi:hypothetical protein